MPASRLPGARRANRSRIVDFHRLPGERPDLETEIELGELIVAVEIPPSRFARSTYRKVRDRASYAFALVSVAAGLTVHGKRDRWRSASRSAALRRSPWRAFRPRSALRGGPAIAQAFEAALADELADATPLPGNAFKLELAQRTLSAVLTELSGERPMSRMQNAIVESVKTVLGWVPAQWLPGGTARSIDPASCGDRTAGFPAGRSREGQGTGALRRRGRDGSAVLRQPGP